MARSLLPVVAKKELRDLRPDLSAPNGYVLDKVESFAIDAAGDAYVITDNDGVDDHSGETQFFALGKLNLPMSGPHSTGDAATSSPAAH
jgi:hypothetical protein